MSKLLIDDYPIQVLPNLAKEIGLNEAIILQQIHYWLNNSKHNHEGKCWIYNSYKEWQKQFPFWSNATIRRAISSLEKQNLLVTGNFNKAGFDKTKWYTIDYDVLKGMSKCIAQNEQTDCSNRANGVDQNEQTNTIDYTETTSETTSNKNILSSSAEQDSTTSKEMKNKKKTSKKEKYGELQNVLLSKDELEKLKEKFSDWENRVNDLSYYIASKNKKYTSHYATILTWARKDKKETSSNNKPEVTYIPEAYRR